MTIRPYAADDIDEVLDVWLRASRIAHHFLSDEFFAQEESEVRETWMTIADTYVYEHQGKVVGFIAMLENEVGAIFVDP
ncbi:MAG: GNAT family N-acetyltransferase, partial [Acidimicrobiia bacterium]|nr:GNAT family N-acetyltransferase [Acidimicrobiia bacterium]